MWDAVEEEVEKVPKLSVGESKNQAVIAHQVLNIEKGLPAGGTVDALELRGNATRAGVQQIMWEWRTAHTNRDDSDLASLRERFTVMRDQLWSRPSRVRKSLSAAGC